MKSKIKAGYEEAYHAMVAWNHKKNWHTFKTLWYECAESWVPIWSPERLWIILSDTVSGKYKFIEENYKV